MKRHITIAVSVLCATVGAFAQSKTDAATQQILDAYRQKQLNPAAKVITPVNAPFDFESTSRATPTAAAIVRLSDGATFDDLRAAGLEVISTAGDDMAVVAGNIEDIIAMDTNADVQSFELSALAKPMLNDARKLNGVTTIHNGDDHLDQPYKGKGVICGIYDTGLDPNHVNFLTSDLTGTRIKELLHFYSSNGMSNIYADYDNISRFSSDNTAQTHGTHTLGIMAGSFNRSGGRTAILTSTGSVQVRSSVKNPYYGMAPEADIVAACGALYDANTCSAVSKIVDYAVKNGQPAVINLSIGRTSGPHDGTSNFGQYMERLGKNAIICISAGNDGDSPISLSKKFSASDKELKTFFVNTSARGTASFSIWADDNREFTVKAVVFNKLTKKVVDQVALTGKQGVLATNNYTDPSYNHSDAFDEAYNSSYINCTYSDNASTNKRYSASIDLVLGYNTTANADKHLVAGLIIEGQDGAMVQCSLNNVSGGFTMQSLDQSGWSDGNSDFTINDLACGKNVISIGAYNNRKTFPALNGGTYSYNIEGYNIAGGIAPYSSYGVLYNGRRLPHICAPGTAVISSYSKYYSEAGYEDTNTFSAEYTDTKRDRKSYWCQSTGTSMSSPAFAGSIALWLQANPKLTIDEVIEIATMTATKDQQTTTTGNSVQWGAGKFNALAGLKEVLKRVGVNDIRIDEQGILVTPAGAKAFEISVPGAKNINVRLVSMTGAIVRDINANGDTYALDLADAPAGVYVLSINNGAYAERILVR